MRHDRIQAVLGRVSIRLRIAALVALALGGAAVFAALYAAANHRIDRAVTAQDGFRHLNDLAATVEARSLALQVEAEQFLRERDAVFAEAFRTDLATLAAALAAMAPVEQAAPETARIAALSDGFAALGREFAALEGESRRLGLREEDGLRGRLTASVKAIEDELKMWPNAAPLMVDMLRMRQAEKDFMLYQAEAAVGRHALAARQFDLALDTSTLAPSTREDFRRLLEAYAGDMAAFAAGSKAVAEAAGRIRSRQAALRPGVQALFAFAHDGMGQAIAEQTMVRASALWRTSLAGLFGVALFAVAAVLIAASIIGPLRRIEGAMKALADGDTGIDIPGAERGDEIGDMAKAVAVFKRNAEAVVRMQAEHDAVRREAEAAGRAKVLSLAQRFEHTVKGVADQVSSSAEIIHGSVGGIAGDSEGKGNAWSLAIAEAAEAARQTITAVTRATEELAGSVGTVAEHGAAVGRVVGSAMAELGTAEDRVRALAEMAGRVDRIVAMIEDIAQRTNMLSLNATIEAQRAGAAGKGFAVVAGEVKRLAALTSEATRDIAGEISAIQAATGETVRAIGGVGRAVREMDGLVRCVDSAVTRQTEATRLIEHCVADVTDKTRVLSEGVTAFTHSAAQQCGAAAKVLWAAEDLAHPTRTLKAEVDGFLSTIRAA